MFEIVALLTVLFVLCASGFSSYFIGRKVYNGLQKNNSKNAGLAGAVTGVLCFFIILAAIVYVIISNIEIHR